MMVPSLSREYCNERYSAECYCSRQPVQSTQEINEDDKVRYFKDRTVERT